MAEGTYPVDLQVERPESSKRVWALFTVIISDQADRADHQLIVVAIFMIGAMAVFFISQSPCSSPASTRRAGTASW